MSNHTSSSISVIEKKAKPAFLIPLLTIILAADMVSVWSGHPSIALQPWHAVQADLTPTYLVEVLLLMATGYFLFVPILQWLAMLLVSKLLSWLVSYQEYGHGWMSIPNLKKLAVSQNNAVAWNYVQSARQAHRREQEAGAHVTLFLLFLLLDWCNPHSLAAFFANFGWHGLFVWNGYVLVCMLYLWVMGSAFGMNYDMIYVGDAFRSLQRHGSTPD